MVYHQGWNWDPKTWQAFLDTVPDDKMYAALDALSHGSGQGERALLWRSREKFDPGAFGEEAQTKPDCTSHGDRNCKDTTRCVEIHIKHEPESYYERGATEPTYGARGHGGAGMDPAKAAKFSRDYGYLVRQNYEGVVDLSVYDGRIGDRWGSRGVPEAVLKLCAEHKVGRYTVPRSTDEVVDLLFNGYAGHSGQRWGCKTAADSKGMARGPRDDRGKMWNHDMGTVGMDDTMEFYPTTVFMVVNSWGRWNKRPQFWPEEAYGPWIEGMMVVPIDQYAKYFVGTGSIMFYSEIDGFPSQKLPNFLTGAWN